MTSEPAIHNEAELSRLAGEIRRRLEKPIVLVGLMGVGKSTIGRKLAQALTVAFHDADDEIEAAAQLSISDIFDRFGEDYFRAGERRVIARLVTEERGVIATGGGAFANDETRRLILERGLAVWLDTDLDTLVERTARRDNRPMLRDGDPREILRRLKAERDLAYAEAPIRITSSTGPHAETVAAILEKLDAWL